MTENPSYELKRLRALVDFYKRDGEERMTYFMHERAQFEKRVFELTTERDAFKRALEANLEAVCGEFLVQYIQDGLVRVEVKDGAAVIKIVSPHAVAQ